jgi:hypothetical protein
MQAPGTDKQTWNPAAAGYDFFSPNVNWYDYSSHLPLFEQYPDLVINSPRVQLILVWFGKM